MSYLTVLFIKREWAVNVKSIAPKEQLLVFYIFLSGINVDNARKLYGTPIGPYKFSMTSEAKG